MSQLEQTLRITGMDCAECATTLERGVQRLAGVQACEVNFAASKMRVVANIDIDETAIHQRIRELGYDVDTTPIKIAAVPEQSRREGIVGFGLFLLERHTTTAALIGCIILVLGFIAHLLNVPSVLRDGLLLASILIAGIHIVADLFSYWHTFASDRRLVNARFPLTNAAIHRDTFARFNKDGIAYSQLI